MVVSKKLFFLAQTQVCQIKLLSSMNADSDAEVKFFFVVVVLFFYCFFCFFQVDEGIEDQNITISGPSSAHQRNTI